MALSAKYHKSVYFTQQTLYKSWKILKAQQSSDWNNVINFNLLSRKPLQTLTALMLKLQPFIVTLAVSSASS
jgi:hypothetical protein